MNKQEQIKYLTERRIMVAVQKNNKISYSAEPPYDENYASFESIDVADVINFLQEEIRFRNAMISKLRDVVSTYWTMPL